MEQWQVHRYACISPQSPRNDLNWNACLICNQLAYKEVDHLLYHQTICQGPRQLMSSSVPIPPSFDEYAMASKVICFQQHVSFMQKFKSDRELFDMVYDDISFNLSPPVVKNSNGILRRPPTSTKASVLQSTLVSPKPGKTNSTTSSVASTDAAPVHSPSPSKFVSLSVPSTFAAVPALAALSPSSFGIVEPRNSGVFQDLDTGDEKSTSSKESLHTSSKESLRTYDSKVKDPHERFWIDGDVSFTATDDHISREETKPHFGWAFVQYGSTNTDKHGVQRHRYYCLGCYKCPEDGCCFVSKPKVPIIRALAGVPSGPTVSHCLIHKCKLHHFPCCGGNTKPLRGWNTSSKGSPPCVLISEKKHDGVVLLKHYGTHMNHDRPPTTRVTPTGQ